MPIRFVDKSGQLGRVSTTLAAAVSAIVGTHTQPATRTGTIATQLGSHSASLIGQFQSNAARTGTIGTTLANATSTIVGTVPASATVGIRFTPGHYKAIDTGSGGGGLAGWVNQVTAISGEPTLAGVQFAADWSDIETNTRGVYDWTILDQIVNAASGIGKKVMLIVKFQYFGTSPTSPNGRFPTYLATVQSGSPGYTVWDGVNPASPAGNLILVANLWNAATMAAYTQLGQAIANRYKNNPAVEMFGIGETSIAILPGSGYSTSSWITQLKGWMTAMRTAWPNTAVRVETNYLDTDAQMQDLIAHAYQNLIACGGPDNYSRTYQSNPIFTGFTGGIDYRNRIPWVSESQYPASSSGGPSATSSQIYQHNVSGALSAGGSTQPQYFVWFNNTFTNSGAYHTFPAETLPFIRSINGACNTTNPYTASWQLAAGHYTKAKLAPTVMHPRPDAETNSWARCRLAPSDIEWRIPIVIHGGAWPFEAVLTAGPSGMVVGQHHGDTDYLILKWPTPTIGTHNYTVRVRTQDYGRTSGSADSSGEITISRTLVVANKTDSTKFLFIDSVNGSNGNSGAYGSPWQTLSAFEAASTAGKQVFFRGGTYPTSAVTGSAGNQFDLASRAKVWIGYPGEVATINFESTSAKYLFLVGPDGFVANLTLSGGNSAADDFWHIIAYGDRNTLFESVSENLHSAGSDGDLSNNSGWSMFTNPATHRYTSIVNNIFRNYTTITNGGASILYSATYAVYDGNVISGMNLGGSTEGFRSKGRCAYISYRNNSAPVAQTFGAGTGAVLSHYQGTDGNTGDTPNHNEICWNYVRGPNNRDDRVMNYGFATYTAWSGYIYRNTFVGAAAFVGPGSTMDLSNNVLLTITGTSNDRYSGDSAAPSTTSTENVVAAFTSAASIVDASGLLLSAYLTSNGLTRGTRGHEVA